jgi:predicted secreted protein
MAILNATDVTLTADGGIITHCTSASLSVNIDLRDSTTKESDGWSSSLGGLKSWEMSGDAFVEINPATGKGQGDMFAKLILGSAVAVIFTLGADIYTGNAFLTSLSLDSGVEENATYSISLTGTDAIELNA